MISYIPRWAQSSLNPQMISLTVQSLAKSVSALIVFLGVIGIVDPAIAQQAWGNFVAAIVTAIPAAVAVYNAGEVLFGVFRKLIVRSEPTTVV